ncbi:MAG: hypothetical protein GWO02_04390, partial [Gammaproteobacteria bacterium]|nr:hypothetical protein [Gammaproteobacteria bacterium]
MADGISCFLLTRQWRDVGDDLQLVFWAASDRGPVRVVVDDQKAVCFVGRDVADADIGVFGGAPTRRPLDLRTLDGAPVDGLYFRRQRDLADTRDALRGRGITLYESDIKPNDRYLMERFVHGAFAVEGEPLQRDRYLEIRNPRLRRDTYRAAMRRIALDVESDGLSGRLYSIAVHGDGLATVFIVSDTPVHVDDARVVVCADEGALLETFFRWLRDWDPDLILG